MVYLQRCTVVFLREHATQTGIVVDVRFGRALNYTNAIRPLYYHYYYTRFGTQWLQLEQTDNHTNIASLIFYRLDALPDA